MSNLDAEKHERLTRSKGTIDTALQQLSSAAPQASDDSSLNRRTVEKQDVVALEATTADRLYPKHASTAGAYLIILYLTLVTLLASVTTGLITTSVPTIGADLEISPQALYWPLSIYSLANGAVFILMGTIADVVGSKRVFLAGTLLFAAFTLGCGLSSTSAQLIVFRALQGVSVAMCLPTSVAILSNAILPGRRRNLGFACTGLGQPLGFSLGLVLGGVFVETVGWRVGWYIVSAVVAAGVPVGFCLLPADTKGVPSFSRLRAHVDWPGVLLISASLAMLTYVLLQLSENQRLIHEPTTIALITISLVLMLAFIYWMQLAARCHRPVLIPNTLWKQTAFTGICLMVMLSYAVMQVLELYCTFFFQKVQGLDALQSSIRLLPSLIIGALLNLTTGLLIHRVSTLWLVFVSSLACSGSPLLMALIDPAWPYWYAAFPAQVLEPVSSPIQVYLFWTQ